MSRRNTELIRLYTELKSSVMSLKSELHSLSVLSNSDNTEFSSLNDSEDETIDKTLARYYENGFHTDVEFIVQYGGTYTRFPCHKLVLSLWSSYFAKKFQQELPKTEMMTVELSDVLPSTFEVLVEYCYGSDTKLQQNRSDILFILKVFRAAKVYQITSLQKLCTEMLGCTVPDKDNVFQLLDAALLMESESLKLRCYKVLQTQTKHILTAENIENISGSVVDMVLDMSSLSLGSEFHLISWVFDWASIQFAKHQGKKEATTLFEFMKPYLPRLNFLSLTPEEFGILVVSKKSFFDEKVGFAIFMNIVCPGSSPLPSWCKSSQEFSRSFKS